MSNRGLHSLVSDAIPSTWRRLPQTFCRLSWTRPPIQDSLSCRFLSRDPKPAEPSAAAVSEADVKADVSVPGALTVPNSAEKSSSGEPPMGQPDNGEGSSFATSVPTVLTWQDLNVTAGAVKILHDVSGYAQPGEVLAIMGASGERNKMFGGDYARFILRHSLLLNPSGCKRRPRTCGGLKFTPSALKCVSCGCGLDFHRRFPIVFICDSVSVFSDSPDLCAAYSPFCCSSCSSADPETPTLSLQEAASRCC